MSNDLQQARVTAAAKAMWGSDLEKSKEFYPERPSMWAKERPAYAEYAALALAAADAVVTVEMIAEVLRRHQAFTHGDSCRCGWVATVGDSSHARHQAFEILALLRGCEER